MATRPGKFEGEPEFVEYYWELAMRGEADEDDGRYSIFRLGLEDTEMWPGAFNKGERLTLWEDDNGFVCHTLT